MPKKTLDELIADGKRKRTKRLAKQDGQTVFELWKWSSEFFKNTALPSIFGDDPAYLEQLEPPKDDSQ